jgi:hypothetical protein
LALAVGALFIPPPRWFLDCCRRFYNIKGIVANANYECNDNRRLFAYLRGYSLD